MSDEWIESSIPDLTGVSLSEIRSNPEYARIAQELADRLLDQPDDGVIICCQPLEIEVRGRTPQRRRL